MSRLAITTLMLALLVPPVYAMDGMIAVPSAHTARSSMDRLEAIAKARDLKVFARIDHAAGAQSIGQALRPTELLIFGHPKGGTPLLQCSQSYGIELPMQVLAWEDAQGKRWLGYRIRKMNDGRGIWRPLAPILFNIIYIMRISGNFEGVAYSCGFYLL